MTRSAGGGPRDVAVLSCRQVAPTFGDPAANRELVAEQLMAAAAEGAHVVVLPELVTTGYCFTDRAEASSLAEPVDGPSLGLWQRLSRDHQLVVIGGFAERTDRGLCNSAVLIDRGELRAVYRKAHLWDAERLVFDAGDQPPPVVDTAVGRVGVMICYDLEFPEWVRRPALAGAHLLCAPVNWPDTPRPAGERPAEVIRVQAGAGVNRMFIAACDRVGPERGVDWVGGSVIVDPDGWVLAGGTPMSSSGSLRAECRLGVADRKQVSRFSDVHADRRPELYR